MISPEQYSVLQQHFPAIGELPAEAQESVRNSVAPFRLGAGDVAFDVDASCEGFPMLIDGRIRVTKPAPSGREILLYRVDPGQTCVLTLNCLLSNSDYSARGVASRECTGFALPQAQFLSFVDHHAGFRNFVFRTLSGRILELMELIEEIAFHRLDQRLAKALLKASEADASGTVPKTHQQIADELGSVREIVSRILGSFADDGLVRLERGRVAVLDRDGLQKVSRDV